MKKLFICILLVAGIAALSVAFMGSESENTSGDNSSYLRVHIRANSNSQEDQSVKYLVRDGVVSYLTPVVAECETKAEAMEKIRLKLNEIARVADGVLKENGYFYGARASLRSEEFPTRVYDDVTLTAGVYDALILELGTGEGDNWWCVVYPPLCFTGKGTNVIYKSKIAEIIRSFYAR